MKIVLIKLLFFILFSVVAAGVLIIFYEPFALKAPLSIIVLGLIGGGAGLRMHKTEFISSCFQKKKKP